MTEDLKIDGHVDGIAVDDEPTAGVIGSEDEAAELCALAPVGPGCRSRPSIRVTGTIFEWFPVENISSADIKSSTDSVFSTTSCPASRNRPIALDRVIPLRKVPFVTGV